MNKKDACHSYNKFGCKPAEASQCAAQAMEQCKRVAPGKHQPGHVLKHCAHRQQEEI